MLEKLLFALDYLKRFSLTYFMGGQFKVFIRFIFYISYLNGYFIVFTVLKIWDSPKNLEDM